MTTVLTERNANFELNVYERLSGFRCETSSLTTGLRVSRIKIPFTSKIPAMNLENFLTGTCLLIKENGGIHQSPCFKKTELQNYTVTLCLNFDNSSLVWKVSDFFSKIYFISDFDTCTVPSLRCHEKTAGEIENIKRRLFTDCMTCLENAHNLEDDSDSELSITALLPRGEDDSESISDDSDSELSITALLPKGEDDSESISDDSDSENSYTLGTSLADLIEEFECGGVIDQSKRVMNYQEAIVSYLSKIYDLVDSPYFFGKKTKTFLIYREIRDSGLLHLTVTNGIVKIPRCEFPSFDYQNMSKVRETLLEKQNLLNSVIGLKPYITLEPKIVAESAYQKDGIVSKYTWLVMVVSSKSSTSMHHAKILIEGVAKEGLNTEYIESMQPQNLFDVLPGQKFTHVFDYNGNDEMNFRNYNNPQRKPFSLKGYRRSQAWMRPATQVFEMLNRMLQEKLNGSNDFAIPGAASIFSSGMDNCITLCKRHLSTIDINLPDKPFDKIVTLPQSHTKSQSKATKDQFKPEI